MKETIVSIILALTAMALIIANQSIDSDVIRLCTAIIGLSSCILQEKSILRSVALGIWIFYIILAVICLFA